MFSPTYGFSVIKNVQPYNSKALLQLYTYWILRQICFSILFNPFLSTSSAKSYAIKQLKGTASGNYANIVPQEMQLFLSFNECTFFKAKIYGKMAKKSKMNFINGKSVTLQYETGPKGCFCTKAVFFNLFFS